MDPPELLSREVAISIQSEGAGSASRATNAERVSLDLPLGRGESTVGAAGTADPSSPSTGDDKGIAGSKQSTADGGDDEPDSKRRYLKLEFSKKYELIRDNYRSVEEVQQALLHAGLESPNLIIGIDFTKSNEWTGKESFGGRSLHAIGSEPNPYEKALSIIGRTLSAFDDDNEIPCFGFGDATTHDKHVFSFNSDHSPCDGFEGALARYRTIVPHLRLAGPTSFAPIINAAVDIVEESGGQYHILIIIADGQVTSVDVADGHMSPQEVATVDAIVNASSYPLSIVLVGVGDGPWDMMKQFDDYLPARSFDNFLFVNFTQLMQRSLPPSQKEASFALAALMEIPEQHKAIQDLSMLSNPVDKSPSVKPLRPPPKVLRIDGQPAGYQSRQAPNYNGYQHQGRSSAPPVPTAGDYPVCPPPNPYGQYEYSGYYNYSTPPSAPAASSYHASRTFDDENLDCPFCLIDKKDMAFNCGHQTCRWCANSLIYCPICRELITQRIRLY